MKPYHITPKGIIYPPTIRQQYKMAVIQALLNRNEDTPSEAVEQCGWVADEMIKEDKQHEEGK